MNPLDNQTLEERAKVAARRLTAQLLAKGYRPVGFYTYTLPDGTPDHWKIRLDHPDPPEGMKPKECRPMRWVGPGPDDFKMQLPPAPPGGRLIYRLHDLATRSAEPEYFIEGEKCADALDGLGLLATTSGSSSSAGDADLTPLAGRKVIFWRDNDESGEKYEAEIVKKLLALECSVETIDVTTLGLPKKGDCADWIDRRRNELAAEGIEGDPALRDRLRAEIEALPRHSVKAASVDVVEDWPEPQSLDDSTTAAQYPLFALPPILGDAVREYLSYCQLPDSLAACSALSVMSVAVQGQGDVARDKALIGPTSLYVLPIAESGERKSAADTHFGSILREWERSAGKQFEPKIIEAGARLAAWERVKDSIMRDITSAAAAKKPTDDLTNKLIAHEGQQPVVPVTPRLIYSNISMEGLLSALEKGHPSAAISTAEGGTVTGSYAMNPEAITASLATLNDLWSAMDIVQVRKTADSISVSGRRLSVNIMIQPTALSRFIDRSEGLARGSGFFSRFLITFPATKQGYRPYQSPPDGMPAHARFRTRILELLDRPLVLDESGRITPPLLELSPEAFEVWKDYYNRTEIEQREGRAWASVRDFASKSAEQAARLAGCFHLFAGSAPSAPVAGPVMTAATLVAGWHLAEARRVFGPEPAVIADARGLEAWVVKRDDHRATFRDIQRGLRRFRDQGDSLEAAVTLLVARGRAKIITAVRGDSRSVVLNPQVVAASHFDPPGATTPAAGGDSGDGTTNVDGNSTHGTPMDLWNAALPPGDAAATPVTEGGIWPASVTSGAGSPPDHDDAPGRLSASREAQKPEVSPVSPRVSTAMQSKLGSASPAEEYSEEAEQTDTEEEIEI
jgi:hypothetical protein